MTAKLTVRFLVAMLIVFGGQHAGAAISGTTRVASGLSSPLFATFAPGDANHLFVLEKGGNIKVIDLTTKTVLSTPFLHIPDTDAATEGGLLGLAFSPDYAQVGSSGYGKFYVYVTVDNGGQPVPGGTAMTATSPFSTHIRQYSVSSNPYVANTTATEIMSWPRPEANHVGGWIGFGPNDGYLYINSGDGGSSYDSAAGHYEPGGNAQNITNSPNDFMGKQLRIDVNGDAFPTDPNQNYSIPPTNPFVGVTGPMKSGRTVCAIPIAAVSIEIRATNGLPTSAKLRRRKLILSRLTDPMFRTSVGDCGKEALKRRRAGLAAQFRTITFLPFTTMTTAPVRIRAMQLLAAMSIVVPTRVYREPIFSATKSAAIFGN